MKKFTKIATLAVLAIATTAFAANVAYISGRVAPGSHHDHQYSVGPGFWTVDLTNQRVGDLDVKVYDEDGDLVASDTLADNHPIATFYNAYKQDMTFCVLNADEDREAVYSGSIRAR